VKQTLCTLLGLIGLAVSNISYSQQSVSTPVGFHTEIIKGNSFSLLGTNVSNHPAGDLARSISQAFGPNNEAGLTAGLWDEADNIWVPHNGGYKRLYYNDEDRAFPPITVGWRAFGHGDADMSDFQLPQSTGIFFQSRAEEDWYVTFGGYVRETKIQANVVPGINVLNRGFPADITLQQSGIDSSDGFTPGDSANGDIVWCFREDGSYDRYYYIRDISDNNPFKITNGWKKIGGGDDFAGTELLSSAFIIEVRGAGGGIVLYPPALLQRLSFITTPAAPPRPIVYPTFVQDDDASQYFLIYWYAYNANVNYHTEIYSPGNWWHLSTQTNMINQPLTNFAPLSFGSGIARVVAEYKEQVKP